MNLNTDEREQFAIWLEQDARETELLLGQLRKLGPSMLPVIRHHEQEIAAQRLIAHKLRSIESVKF